MNKRILKIIGWVLVLALVLGVGAAAGGAIVYAMTRSQASPQVISAGQIDQEPGIVIVSVAPDGPAAEAGVVRGDILLEIDGEAVDTVAQLTRAIQEREPGDEIELTVLHGDDERTLTTTVGDRDGEPYLGLLPCRSLVGPGEVVIVSAGEPGATIVHVEPDSPADLAGLESGDVIVAVDEEELDSETSLADAIQAHEPGDQVTLEVSRPGEESRDVTVELGENPDEEGVAYLGVRYRSSHPFGALSMEEVSPDRWPARPFGWRIDPGRILPDGETVQGAIVRRVTGDSPAEEAGLGRGDLITGIDGDPVEGPRDLADAIAGHEPGDRVTLTVIPKGETEEREIEVQLAEHPDEEKQAYLGVEIGGFIHVQSSGGDADPDEEKSFEYFFDWEPRFEEWPFDPDDGPHRFEFHFPPTPFDTDDADLLGGSV